MKKNEAADLMELNIQLFADTAENDSDAVVNTPSVDTDNAGSEEKIEFVDGTPDKGTDDKDEVKITTKAFSERLKREKQKMATDAEQKKINELNRIAIAKGFKDWKELDETVQKERLEKLGIEDTDALASYVQDVVSANPVVVEAAKIIEQNKQSEQEKVLNDAITEIGKLDSDIKSLDDLLRLENYDEFFALAEKGYSLPDAYKIVAFDKIASKRVAGATQNVITNINSKSHMTTLAGNKAKNIVVPDEVMASYKKNLPYMTDEQIKEHYAKFLGGE